MELHRHGSDQSNPYLVEASQAQLNLSKDKSSNHSIMQSDKSHKTKFKQQIEKKLINNFSMKYGKTLEDEAVIRKLVHQAVREGPNFNQKSLKLLDSQIKQLFQKNSSLPPRRNNHIINTQKNIENNFTLPALSFRNNNIQLQQSPDRNNDYSDINLISPIHQSEYRNRRGSQYNFQKSSDKMVNLGNTSNSGLSERFNNLQARKSNYPLKALNLSNDVQGNKESIMNLASYPKTTKNITDLNIVVENNMNAQDRLEKLERQSISVSNYNTNSMRAKLPDEWTEIIQYQKEIHEQEVLNHRQKKFDSQLNFRKNLEEQIRLRNNVRRETKMKENELLQKLNEVEYEKYLDEKKREQERKSKSKSEFLSRVLQLNASKQTKDMIAKIKHKEEQDLLTRNKQLLREEEERKFLKKQKIQEESRIIIEENIRANQLKEEQKKLEFEQEQRRIQILMKLQEQQEHKRVLETRQREEKINNIMNNVGQILVVENRSKEEMIQKNFVQYQEIKDKQLDKREFEKLDKRERIKNEVNRILEIQIKEKQLKKQNQVHESQVQTEMIKKKIKDDELKEKQQKEEKKKKEIEYHEEIKRQIELKNQKLKDQMGVVSQDLLVVQREQKKLNFYRMDKEEQLLNKELIQKAREYQQQKESASLLESVQD